MTAFVLRQRSTDLLISTAFLIGLAYVLLTFDIKFLAGYGPFWDYPVGPWLAESNDVLNNADILDYLIAYTGWVRSPWHLPVFHVAAIGAPAGTSVVFLDVIPVAALIGRLISSAWGVFIVPYGAWTGVCFILASVFATLVLAEAGQRSLLAVVAASILALSAPTLLHRFGHLPLLAHFLIIGAYFFYLREQRPLSRLSRFLIWVSWLGLSLLINAYMFAMVGAIYAATLLRSWRVSGIKPRLLEPIIIGAILLILMFELGFIGSGASLSGQGFGLYSMNLLSPFVPQRSGLFPSMQRIIDGTGGQYEGFSYFGFGALILLLVALFTDVTSLRRAVATHRELAVILVCVTLFSVSNQVWFGSRQLLDVNIGWKLLQLSNIYRSSGRMFWPVYYVLLFGSLIFVLGRVGPVWRLPLIAACCIFQLLDTEALRARMTSLTNHGGMPILNPAEWSPRIARADFVEVHPTFFCSDTPDEQTADLELQLLAIRLDKSFNVAYNPRLRPDCPGEATRMRSGPWSATTLYVFFDDPAWTPPGLACTSFSKGKWCLGRAQAHEEQPD